ncbi:Cap [Molossus molossus associated circovirus 4]|nr:Cap [Molossus molossus associated circovirus 4]
MALNTVLHLSSNPVGAQSSTITSRVPNSIVQVVRHGRRVVVVELRHLGKMLRHINVEVVQHLEIVVLIILRTSGSIVQVVRHGRRVVVVELRHLGKMLRHINVEVVQHLEIVVLIILRTSGSAGSIGIGKPELEVLVVNNLILILIGVKPDIHQIISQCLRRISILENIRRCNDRWLRRRLISLTEENHSTSQRYRRRIGGCIVGHRMNRSLKGHLLQLHLISSTRTLTSSLTQGARTSTPSSRSDVVEIKVQRTRSRGIQITTVVQQPSRLILDRSSNLPTNNPLDGRHLRRLAGVSLTLISTLLGVLSRRKLASDEGHGN